MVSGSLGKQVKMMFDDREDAGNKLAKRLAKYKGKNPLIIALPRGGVPVAYIIAQELNAELDVIIVRKLGAPGNPELGIGALVEGNPPQKILNEGIIFHLGVTDDFIDEESEEQSIEILRRATVYRGGRGLADMSGRTVIVVDDGIATGATIKAAIKGIRTQNPDKIIVAVPVAPPDVLYALQDLAEEVICVEKPEFLYAIGAYYRDFDQVTDDEVVFMLEEARKFVKA